MSTDVGKIIRKAIKYAKAQRIKIVSNNYGIVKVKKIKKCCPIAACIIYTNGKQAQDIHYQYTYEVINDASKILGKSEYWIQSFVLGFDFPKNSLLYVDKRAFSLGQRIRKEVDLQQI